MLRNEKGEFKVKEHAWTGKIEGTLQGGSWEERDLWRDGEGGGKVSEVREMWTLRGGMEGTGEAVYVMAYQPDGVVGYTGYERLSGDIAGRTGVVYVRTSGEFRDGVARSRWEVISELCSGDFAGATGKGGYDASGHGPTPFVLELEGGGV